MPIYFTDNLGLFCIAFGATLVLTLIMGLQSRHFYTKDVIVRKFSIMDLELAATATEIVNIVKGLYQLPDPRQSQAAVRALKGQLYIDFLYMPAVYGSIFLLCAHVSAKMTTILGQDLFIALAWLQLVSWLCDIIENIYLLGKIRPDPIRSAPAVHSAYLCMEAVKWGLALTAAVSALSTECYFWLSGYYSPRSLDYLLIIVAEVLVFGAIRKFSSL